ncbi:MAG: SseB family protein [Rubrimonas sp.]
MTLTPLDRAHAAAEAPGAPDDARARFYALLLETPLCVPVEPQAGDAGPKPLVFALEDGPVALGFDDDARMAAFFEAPTEYVTLPGRALATLLAQAGLGLGLNLGEAPSAALLDADLVRWIAAEMGGGLDAAELTGPLTLASPEGATPGLLAALAERLAAFPGMVAGAWLARLGPEGAPGRLTALILPADAAVRGAQALAAELGRAAAPHAPVGEDVAVGLLNRDHPLIEPARRRGIDLLAAPTDIPRPERAPATPRPPVLR